MEREKKAGLVLRDLGTPAWARPTSVAILIAADTLVISAVAITATLLWAVRVHAQPLQLYLQFWPILVLFVLDFARAGLYPGFGLGAIETLRRICLQTSFIFIIVAAAYFVLRVPHQISRMTFFLTWLGCVILIPTVRYLLLSKLSRTKWWGEPAVVIGSDDLARLAIRSIRNAASLGYRPVVVVLGEEAGEGTVEGLEVLSGFEAWREPPRHGVHVALVSGGVPETSRTLRELESAYRHVILLREDLPVEAVAVRNLGGILGIEFHNQLLRLRVRVVKRTLDILLGAVALVLAAPIIALAAFAVRLVNWGPAFFVQEREGRDGRLIRVPKLRTMYADAEARLEAHLRSRPEVREEWESRFKLSPDPRVLPVVGTLLRRFSLDELPQLWSVVRGDMSLVGPRPFPEYHLDPFPKEFRSLRRRVRPGLTGLWQVLVRSDGGLAEQLRFDTYYIRNWSLWMDLYVLARTFGAVLSGRGAY